MTRPTTPSPLSGAPVQTTTPGVSSETWYQFFVRFTAITSAISLVLALVFFVAYNWMALGKLGKFGLVEAALVLTVLGYALLAHKGLFKLGQPLLLLIASLITGSLLALVGQVYQTGADSWQLFFGWAVLIIPWVIVARLPALWLLWLGLINLSFLFYTSAASFFVTSAVSFDLLRLLVLTAINLLALVMGLMAFKDKAQPKLSSRSLHWSLYLIAIAVMFWATRLGLFSVFLFEKGVATPISLAAWAGVMGFFYWRFYKKQIDLLMLTLLSGSVILVLMVMASQYIAPYLGDAALFVMAFLLIAVTALAVNWLRQLNHSIKQPSAVAQQSPEFLPQLLPESLLQTTIDSGAVNVEVDNSPTHSTVSTPWYIQLLLTLSGLFSGALITGFLMVVFGNTLRDMLMKLILSALLLLISFVLFNLALFKRQSSDTLHKPYTFSDGLAFALSLSAQAFLAVALVEQFEATVTVVSTFMLLQLVLLIVFKDTLHRFFSAFMALGCMVWLLSYFQLPELSAPLLALIASVVSLPNSKVMTAAQSSEAPHRYTLFRALNYASTIMLLMVSVVFIVAENSQSIVGVAGDFFYNYFLSQGLLIAVCLYVAHIILSQYSLKLTSKIGRLIALAIIGLGLVSIYISGVLATSLVIVLAIANANKTLLTLGISALVGYIFWYYYQLDTSLLQKSGSLLAVSLVLFAIYKLIKIAYSDDTSLPKLETAAPEQTTTKDEELP
ncbi:DUF2157 domain-containing protein [Psychrobacter phenylpyruvicus]|uniref:Uncharacterized membrane-anchored protein n=1 Tax=Psychrobacter phenylpyruvicus TaxID=29432 RepID=A0A379LPP3_9GAMM|nr:DUF4401 domain-containing protein [Psychrobacter phenylpyruvicus]SUD92065.1 Uncharacterized membrane-anchored protein [Psychrobacter phenylpyruvicus]